MQEHGNKSDLEALPMELHGQIRDELLNDPDLSNRNFKPLRLVSNTFNAIWTPVVLSKVNLYPDFNHGIFENLRRLVHDGTNNLVLTHTIILHCSSTEPIRCALKIGSSEATPMPQKLQLPNVRCVKLLVSLCASTWVIDRSTRLLLVLPALTELHLQIVPSQVHIPHIAHRLAELRSLRKFKFVAYAGFFQKKDVTQSSIDCFSIVIANNPNLTHLSLSLVCEPYYLSRLFRDIPADRPLKLENLSLTSDLMVSADIVPHVQSLQSFYCFVPAHWCKLFTEARIFPPKLQAFEVTDDIITYLTQHPGITSLAFSSVESSYAVLFRTLGSNLKTLHFLALRSHELALALKTPEERTNFLQCVHLKELVLYPCFSDCSISGHASPSGHDEKQIVPVAARLNRHLTVVIADERCVFDKVVWFCRLSEDEGVRDIAERLVFGKREGDFI